METFTCHSFLFFTHECLKKKKEESFPKLFLSRGRIEKNGNKTRKINAKVRHYGRILLSTLHMRYAANILFLSFENSQKGILKKSIWIQDTGYRIQVVLAIRRKSIKLSFSSIHINVFFFFFSTKKKKIKRE